MKLYSTKRQSAEVSFEEAVFRGLPPDNGLYMPLEIPKLPQSFFDNIENLTFSEIAFTVANALIGDDIPSEDLKAYIDDMLSFDAPLVEIEKDVYSLELWHGPSHAFKDFGARFMSRVMSHFLKKSNKRINILVATSGDTGGAVAMGFLGIPNITVTILYPSGKVSYLQEKQLTTLGQNIYAIEVNGTFDDCQALVKQAFMDQELSEKLGLSSANSINIARLIPQSFYYFNSYAQLKSKGLPVVFSVPSGNFGNLCGGLIAYKMGLPVHQFVASTNMNDIVPKYFSSGEFNPKASIRTLSNAMDVGNPSNFVRLAELFGNDVSKVNEMVKGYSFDDELTKDMVRDGYEGANYIMCPHTAVAYLGLIEYKKTISEKISGVFLSTAHPAKFINETDKDIAAEIELPEGIKKVMHLEKKATKLNPDFEELKKYLLENVK